MLQKFKDLLKDISVGQYSTKMFYENSDSQSSVIGGIITIFCAVLLISYLSYTL